MPKIYLSPSTQEFNQFINGGNEEYYMNLIVDAMIPYLRASGIEFTRNNPGNSVPESIERSNEYPYDLHLALQSRSTSDVGTPQRGIDVFHYAVSSINGELAAYIIANNLKRIYPLPNKVSVIPDLTMLELSQTNAPAVLVELGYHDNPEDASWIKNNINAIGRNLAMSVTQFLNVPFVEPFGIDYMHLNDGAVIK
jgi:N-acetylmuramoyl-L-alanine amidase